MIPLFDYEPYRLIMVSPYKFMGYDFLYFDTPVDFYTLYRRSRKINTFNEFEYIAEVLIHLNPQLEYQLFYHLMLQLGDRANGHVVRTYSIERVSNMCSRVFEERKRPYCRNKRKILFNSSKMIHIDEKRAIIGAVLSNRINQEIIYDAIEELMNYEERITYQKIGELVGASRQTVSKKITGNLREIINHHNKNL